MQSRTKYVFLWSQPKIFPGKTQVANVPQKLITASFYIMLQTVLV